MKTEFENRAFIIENVLQIDLRDRKRFNFLKISQK